MVAVNLILAATFLLGAAACLLASTSRRFAGKPGEHTTSLRDLYTRRLVREGDAARRRHQELSRSLRQAGYVGVRSQVAVLMSCLTLMLTCGVMVTLISQLGGATTARSLSNGMVLLLVLGLLMLFFLRNRIAERKLRMEGTIDIVIQVTRMLWSTGMTLESLFERLVEHLDDVAPDTVREIQIALARIQSGQEREDVLESVADYQPYNGLADYFRLLSQVSSIGGRSSKSLDALGTLLRDGRRLRLQEKMTRMSAKMSLVMMLCFFPALLIIMAGPAFMGMGELLQSLSSGQ